MASTGWRVNGAARPLGYISGRVDARKSYEAWRSGSDAEGFGTMYLLHFFTAARDLGRDAVVLTSHGQESYEVDYPGVKIINRPHPDPTAVSGLQYHVRELGWTIRALRLLQDAGAGTIVLTDNPLYWFVTPVFRASGIRFVNALHCTLSLLIGRDGAPRRILNRVTGWLHYAWSDPTIGVSPAILRQVAAMPGARRRWSRIIVTDYPRPFIDSIARPRDLAEDAERPARVIFAGRCEVNKGVMDLLEACRLLQARAGRPVSFDVCGGGGALEPLRAEVARLGLEPVFTVHGLVSREEMAALYGQSDIVVVPTRSTFEEGEPRALIEGVLVRRPVVSSRVCPILEVVADACVEVEADNPAAYADAIWRLANDPALAADKRAAAVRLREIFFDPPDSYANALTAAVLQAEL